MYLVLLVSFPLNSHFLCCSSQELSLLAENWKVYGGVVSLNRLPEPYLVERIILSENYNSVTNDQDIALLKLTKPVVFDGQSQLHFILKINSNNLYLHSKTQNSTHRGNVPAVAELCF